MLKVNLELGLLLLLLLLEAMGSMDASELEVCILGIPEEEGDAVGAAAPTAAPV